MGCAGEAESVVIYGVSQFVDHSSISQSNEATLSTPECSQIAVTPPPPTHTHTHMDCGVPSRREMGRIRGWGHNGVSGDDS